MYGNAQQTGGAGQATTQQMAQPSSRMENGTSMLEVMAQKANLDLMESNARKADEEAKLLAEQRTGTELENAYKGIQNETMNATKENVIAISQKSLEEINLRVSNLEKEGRLTEANINLVNEQKANIVTDTLLKESNISVNDEVKKQIKANIINMKEQIKLGKMSIEQIS